MLQRVKFEEFKAGLPVKIDIPSTNKINLGLGVSVISKVIDKENGSKQVYWGITGSNFTTINPNKVLPDRNFYHL